MARTHLKGSTQGAGKAGFGLSKAAEADRQQRLIAQRNAAAKHRALAAAMHAAAVNGVPVKEVTDK